MKPTKLTAVGSLLGNYSDLGYDASTDTISYYKNQTPPKDSEIDAELKKLQAEYDANQYQRDRQYPTIEDQLDLLYHDMTSGKGDKTGEWYKAVKKVKDDNPKG